MIKAYRVKYFDKAANLAVVAAFSTEEEAILYAEYVNTWDDTRLLSTKQSYMYELVEDDDCLLSIA